MAKTYTYRGRRVKAADMLRDPKKRATLPMSALSAKQQVQRKARVAKQKANSNPLYNPTATLTGNDLKRTAESLTDLEIKPRLGALDRAGQQSERQGGALIKNAGDYYGQLNTEGVAGLARQAALNQRLQQSMRQTGTDAQQRLQTAGDDIAKVGSEDAAIRGAHNQSAGSAMTELAAARGLAAAQAQTGEQASAREAAAGEGLLNEMTQVRTMRGGEVQERLSNRMMNDLAELRAQKTDLESSRGDVLTSNIMKLRDAGFTNEMTKAGLLSKEQQAALQASSQGQQVNQWGYSRDEWLAMTPARRQQIMKSLKSKPKGTDMGKVNSYGYTEKEWRAMSTAQRQKVIADSKAKGGKGAKGNKMPAGPRKVYDQVNSAVLEANSAGVPITSMDPNTGEEKVAYKPVASMKYADVYKAYRDGGMKPLQAKAAAELAKFGYLTRVTARELRKAGVRISKDWRIENSNG